MSIAPTSSVILGQNSTTRRLRYRRVGSLEKSFLGDRKEWSGQRHATLGMAYLYLTNAKVVS